MKTLKSKIGIAVSALLIGAAAMSFSMKENDTNKNVDTVLRWQYTGNTSDNEGDQTAYILAGSMPNCQSHNSVICTIEAPEDGDTGFPDLSQAIVLSKKF